MYLTDDDLIKFLESSGDHLELPVEETKNEENEEKKEEKITLGL